MSKLLIETYDRGLELLKESKDLPPNCLGALRGICADYKDPTRNGRFYSEKLWKRVFEDERIKEGLETKTLFGELDHPADRLESLAKEAAIVMTDYKFDEDNKKVLGEFHILDTPNGRILKSLVDYGSKVGVSSRGRGEINEKDNKVEEDTYVFGGFDVVTLPSIKTARPEYKLTNESLEVKNFSSSIMEEIENADLGELEKIEHVVKITELPPETLQSLTESIEHRRENFNKKYEKTCAGDSTTVTSENKLQEDLEDAYETIEKLEKELRESKKSIPDKEELNEGIANEVVKSLNSYKGNDEWNDVILSYPVDLKTTDKYDDGSRSEIAIFKDGSAVVWNEVRKVWEVSHKRNLQLPESIDEDFSTDTIGTDDLYLEISDLREELDSYHRRQIDLDGVKSALNESSRKLEALQKDNESLLEKLGNKYEDYQALELEHAKLTEKFNIVNIDHDSLQEDYDEIKEHLDTLNTEYSSLKEKFNNVRSKEVKTLESRNSKLLKVVSDLEEEVENLETSNSELHKRTEQYQEELSNFKEQIEEKQESYDELDNSFNELFDSYLEIRAEQAGVSQKALKEQLDESYGLDDVENTISYLYEEKSRQSNLPFDNEGLYSFGKQSSNSGEYKNAKTMLKPFKKPNNKTQK